ncbi:MAG: hypothetical protein JJD92_06415 [Frankiaceae bacterium]|nr:hypothetical protein [Frankiaceae bacterium]
MEILLIVGLLMLERLRVDLPVRRWCARVLPRPTFGPAWAVPVPVALAGFDVRRLVPRVLTLLVALVMLRAVSAGRPPEAYNGVNQTIGFYWAMTGLFVLVLVATVGGRDREQEALAALPVGPRSRVRGVALTVLLASLVVYVLAALRWLKVQGGSYDALLPNGWELAQPALMVLGGGMLGLLVARLLPVWAAVPVAAIGAIFWTGAVGATRDWVMLAPVYEWVKYDERNPAAAVLHPGSFGWHNAFLLGLCGLGLLAALLREHGPRRGLVFTGVGLTTATVAAALLALP